MKKISRKDLQGLHRQFAALTKEEMQHYVGGYSDGYFTGGMGYGWGDYGDFPVGPGGYPGSGYPGGDYFGGGYSYSNPYFDAWLNSGSYYTDSYGNFFWYSDGSQPNYYTMDQFDDMINNGTWNGGYVEGWGYVGKDNNIFSGEGDYYTFPDYLRSSSTPAWKHFADTLLDKIIEPWDGTSYTNTYRKYMEQRIDNINYEMQARLLEMGYDRSANLFVGTKPIYNGTNSKVRFSVYNTDTGALILYMDMDVLGSYY